MTPNIHERIPKAIQRCYEQLRAQCASDHYEDALFWAGQLVFWLTERDRFAQCEEHERSILGTRE